ncbi:MAG: ABC transporter permease [Thermoanaerobaculia bacterium]|nr:ABC transporter permease [Thermoanaerobaculia bacterium]
MSRFLEHFHHLPWDLKQALRSFSRRPALVAVSVLSLALGIGANAALFSVADAVLFSDLPYSEPDRVVRIWESFEAGNGTRWTGSVSAPNLFDWRERSTRFESIGGYSYTSVNLTSGGVPQRARSVRLEAQVFDVLGVQAARGRVLTREDVEGDGRVVVLSDRLWRQRYEGAESLVGGTIDLGGEAYQVAGVMPADFEFPPKSETDLWLPQIFEPRHYEDSSRGSHWLSVVGRLAEGADLEAGIAEMEALAAQIAEEHPKQQNSRGVVLKTLQENTIGDARPVLYALWGAVGFVLLIASGNVAHLLLARATRRRQEMALRSALGAGRSRIAVLVLIESLLLALAGGGLGLFLGGWAVKLLAQLPGSTLPRGLEISLDLRVFFYALATGLLAAVLAGAIPAWRASRVDLRSALGTARSALGHRDRMRGLLVVAEMALALAVTLGAALMVRSLAALESVETGLDPEKVLTLRVPMPEERYDSETLPGAFRSLQDSISQLPGIESAGWIQMLPFQDWGWNAKVWVAGEEPPNQEDPWVEYRVIEGDYFQVLGIPLLSGRGFGLADDVESTGVVMINRTLAELYWPGRSPLGAQVGFGGAPDSEDGWLRVVGVVGDVQNAGLDRPPRPEMYFPAAQRPLREMSLVVRTRVIPEAMTEEIRQAVLAQDPLQPIYRVRTMDEVVRRSTADRSFDTLLLTVFAGLALLLAVVGVYSVMSHDVGLRRSEVGLRMALGADPGGVLRLFVGRGLRLALLGAVLGAGLASLATRLLESRLYGIEATDPTTYVAGAAVLMMIATAACILPALRAARLQPTDALRDE